VTERVRGEHASCPAPPSSLDSSVSSTQLHSASVPKQSLFRYTLYPTYLRTMSQLPAPTQGLHVQQLPAPPEDPTHESCPKWTEIWNQLYIQSLMDAELDANGVETRPARSRTEAVAEATGAWTAEHNKKLADWTAWLDLRADAEAKDADNAAKLAQESAARAEELARQEEVAAQACLRKEEDDIAENLRLTAVKKLVEQQSVIFDIPEDVAPSADVSLSPSPYALNQLSALKVPSLMLFSPDYIRDKQEARYRGGFDESDVSIMKLRPDGQIETVAAGAPKNVIPNADLPWNTVTAALPVLAEAMKSTLKYSDSACASIAALSVALSTDSNYRGDERERANVLYVAIVLDKFFDALKNHKPHDPRSPRLFNPARIEDTIWDRVSAQMRNKEQRDLM
jgi:hypothetical protein